VYEKPKQYGPVVTPKNDLPLKEATSTLKKAFLSDQIQIAFANIDNTNKHVVPVVKNSLTEIWYDTDGFININRDLTEEGFSGGILFQIQFFKAQENSL
jgi:hypothetical protein